MQVLSEQEQVRRASLSKLEALGINPYPADLYEINASTQSIKEAFKDGEKVTISGRIMSRRIMGKASFAELQDV